MKIGAKCSYGTSSPSYYTGHLTVLHMVSLLVSQHQHRWHHQPLSHPHPPTTTRLLQKVTTLKACQPAQGSSTDKWFPKGTAVPTQHHKSGPICFKKWGTNIFRNCSQPLCKAGERAHARMTVSTGALRNMEKGISRPAIMPLYDIQTPQLLFSYL